MLIDLRPRDSWMPISIAPLATDLEVCVIRGRAVHPLAFPCYRVAGGGWIDATTRRPLALEPTHWRSWIERRSLIGCLGAGAPHDSSGDQAGSEA